ncbi:MAG: CoA transferase, partial [Pseudomonadota bacterium]
MFQKGPLKGVRVVELGHIMAGPVCGLMLADLGADVVKIEKTKGGDDTRRALPPAIGDQAAAFLMVNRNKRGVAIDLKHPDGAAAARRLMAGADIVVVFYRKGGLDKLGLGYESFADENPGL